MDYIIVANAATVATAAVVDVRTKRISAYNK